MKSRTVLSSVALAAVATLTLAVGGSAQPRGAADVAPKAAVRAASVANTKCADGANQVASIDPKVDNVTTDPATIANSPTLRQIKARGRLVVGTSGDVLLWGYTNPKNGALEGYDIDVLKEVARAIDPAYVNTIEYRVVNYGQRLTSLEQKSVDLVAHTMTINCDRWQGTGTAPNAINFSSEYYQAGQKMLVRGDSAMKTVADIGQLKGKPVCVPKASTNEVNVAKMGFKLIALDVIGDCLVKFQEGEVVAITGDDTVLAGFAAQDPYAKVLPGKPLSEEPYGLGINQNDQLFTEFVNAVIQRMRTDGTLQRLYEKWMADAVIGDAPPVPQAVYDRKIAQLGRKG